MSDQEVLVLDNGGCAIKAAMVGTLLPSTSKHIPNCIFKAKSERKRLFVGDQINDLKDLSGLFYVLPYQRVNPKDMKLILTEPVLNFASIQETMDEVFFEEHEFQGLLRISGPELAAYEHLLSSTSQEQDLLAPGNEQVTKAEAVLVVDSGYSFTHVVPVFRGAVLKHACLRIDVGGKALTNHLKELVSYRYLDVMDETYVMNQCKEDACYISMQLRQDLELARKKCPTVVKDYVLPNFTTRSRGILRDVGSSETESNEQVLRLGNERFMVPELLFNPSDVGIDQVGIPEAIVHAVSRSPEFLQGHLYSNIVLIGGSVKFPGFKERVYSEVRALAPDCYEVSVHLSERPEEHAMRGGVLIAQSPYFDRLVVTKQEYDERGSSSNRGRS